ncbi:MAG TPA: zinc-binding dehydrogenase [Trueperaceae bacterium]|nr:zinc-binding dehydrogenase [Trueperaceae bacterium]
MEAVMKLAPGPGHVALGEVPEPRVGPGQAIVEVSAAGICGTDLHIRAGEFPTRPPVVMGHELAGRVVAVGDDVRNVREGARVTSETYFHTCGHCRYCRDGQPNLCPERLSIGSAVNGAFTRYLLVPATNLHELPDQVSDLAGALTEPLACVVHGVLGRPTVTAGDVAVIAGPGAIGLLTLQVVRAAGATTVVLGTDADEARLDLASSLGADHVIIVQQGGADDLVRSLSSGGHGADVVYECSGAGPAAQSLLELVRRRGRYVQIGLFGRPVAFDLDQLCYRELVATGSNASTPASWRRALQLLAAGVVDTEALVSEVYELADWSRAFGDFDAKRGVKLLFAPVG